MRAQLRSLGMVGGAVVAAATLGWAAPMSSVVQLLATTALIMGGTEHPLVRPDGDGTVGNDPLEDDLWVLDYVQDVERNYLEPTEVDRGVGAGPYRLVAVHTPEEFAPIYGAKTFDDSVREGADNLATCMDESGCTSHAFEDPDVGVPDDEDWVIVGYSQSARIATLEKQRLITAYNGHWQDLEDDVSFVLISNPNRPNGGVLMRFHGLSIPFLGVTMDGASPTDSCVGSECHLPTVDVAHQYDALGGDFPMYPINLLATANSIVAYLMVHGDMPDTNLEDGPGRLQYQGQFGDTDYYMVGSDIVPLLMPLERLGVPRALLLALDEPLRVLIETAYRRDISPGEPTPAHLLPVVDPVRLLTNLLASIPVGLDDAFEEVGGGRPFRTTPSGIYGVGGEDEELEGAPPGYVPLGAPDPTTSTERPSAPGLDVDGTDPGLPAQNTASVAETPAAQPAPVVEVPGDESGADEVRRQTAGDPAGDATPPRRTEVRRKGPVQRFVERVIGKRHHRSAKDESEESEKKPTQDDSEKPASGGDADGDADSADAA